jgi:outer membrane murein-binding lipoprotein Lpp
MRTPIALVTMLGLGVAMVMAVGALTIGRAAAADCDQGSSDDKVACLAKKVADLEAQVAELTKETLKWNDRIALRNEDMRVFPRCLENPGPNTRGLTDVYANSCAKIPAQTWMIAKPYQ